MDFVIPTNHRPERVPITPNTAEHDLITAIRNREDLRRIQALVEGGADIASIPDGYWTPLTLAAHLGRADVINFLLKWTRQKQDESSSSADQPSKWLSTVDGINDGGLTPLLCAAREGHADICQALLQAGADINRKNLHSGQTPLLVAIDNQRDLVVKVLLDFGAEVQLTDNVGITPLYAAVCGNNCRVVEQLIDAGCDVNIGSQDHAPLFIAARRGYLPIVKVLCEAGCSVNIANKYGVTPLYEAAFKGNTSVVKYLLERGCDVNAADMYGVSPLMAATMASNRDGVAALWEAGACVKLRDFQGRCAVRLAIESGKASILELFLQHGVDISRRPPLAHSASTVYSVFEREHLPTAIVLLRGCSDLDLTSLTSLSMARQHPQLLELLLASGLTHPPSALLQRSALSDSRTPFSPKCRRWLQNFHSQPRSLKSLARGAIRRSMGNTILHGVHKLPLPSLLKDYVAFLDIGTSGSCCVM